MLYPIRKLLTEAGKARQTRAFWQTATEILSAKRAREVMSSRWVDREALDLYSETTASGVPTLTPKEDRGSHGNGH